MIDEIIDGIIDWLIDINRELILAENKEDYAECIILRDAIHNYIHTNAEILMMTKNIKEIYTVDDIITKLTIQSSYIYNQLKENQP